MARSGSLEDQAGRRTGQALGEDLANGASHSSWHSTPTPASQVRWMRRYDGGRLSFMPTIARLRRSLMRANWCRIHSRLKWKRSTLVGSTNGAR